MTPLMNDIIVIKCPWCSTPLKVRNQPGLENKSITCPVCSNKSPFTSFGRATTPVVAQSPAPQSQPVMSAPDEGETRYRPAADLENQTTGTGSSDPGAGSASKSIPTNTVIGTLKVIGSTEPFQLKKGRNVIGRKATSSGADIQIPTGNSKTVSREHLVIDVKDIPGAGITHYVSLYKENVNRTFIGPEQLMPGDVIKLKSGDIIRLHDITLKFEIIDPDATTIA